MAPPLRGDVVTGGVGGEARIATKGAKCSLPGEAAVLGHPITKGGKGVVAIVEGRPQRFPGRDPEFETSTMMRGCPPHLAYGSESALDIGGCAHGGERFGERGASGVFFNDQRVIKIEDDGVHHGHILASPSPQSAGWGATYRPLYIASVRDRRPPRSAHRGRPSSPSLSQGAPRDVLDRAVRPLRSGRTAGVPLAGSRPEDPRCRSNVTGTHRQSLRAARIYVLAPGRGGR